MSCTVPYRVVESYANTCSVEALTKTTQIIKSVPAFHRHHMPIFKYPSQTSVTSPSKTKKTTNTLQSFMPHLEFAIWIDPKLLQNRNNTSISAN